MSDDDTVLSRKFRREAEASEEPESIAGSLSPQPADASDHSGSSTDPKEDE